MHVYLLFVECLCRLQRGMKCRNERCCIDMNTVLSLYLIMSHIAPIMPANMLANSLYMLYYNHRVHLLAISIVTIVIDRLHFQQCCQYIRDVLWRVLIRIELTDFAITPINIIAVFNIIIIFAYGICYKIFRCIFCTVFILLVGSIIHIQFTVNLFAQIVISS